MKKILLVILSLALMLGSVPATVSAKQLDTAVSQENMEKILIAVKSKINIPKDCTQFEYNFYEDYSYSGIIWSFYWYSEESDVSISISADNNGNIISYDKYFTDYHKGEPKYLKNELESEVDEFVYSMSNEFKGNLTKAYAENYNSERYYYRYTRIANGITMPDNNITVEVDNRTGEIVSYSANWLFKLDIPKADIKITAEEAAAKIGKNIEMKLRYIDRYVMNDDGKYVVETFLAYYPDEQYIAVDAKTGKIYTDTSEWRSAAKGSESPAAMNSEAKSEYSLNDAGASLTEQEIEGINELKDIISREEAVKLVTENKSLLLDKSMISVNASLTLSQNYYDDTKKYVWRVNLSDPTEPDYENGDYYRASARASIDAKTGELISFSATCKDYYSMNEEEQSNVKTKYSAGKCKKIFEAFAKKQNSDRFASTVYTGRNSDYIISIKEDNSYVYGGNTFQYSRVNEDVIYESNYIYGAVDAVTGKIYRYGYTWNDSIKFDSPKNIINADEAFKKYIGFDGYDLVYETVTVNNYTEEDQKTDVMSFEEDNYYITFETRLVYRTDISPSYVSAFTGKQLDYEGKELSAISENGYTYDDITGTKYERSIRILADLGLGFTGGKYQPDKAITKEEFKEMLQKEYYFNENEFKLSGDKKLSRQLAAKTAAYCLGMNRVAEIEGIFKTSYADNDKISEKYLGYVAMVNGLSLMEADKKNNFNPEAALTRGEAADMIIRMFGTEGY